MPERGGWVLFVLDPDDAEFDLVVTTAVSDPHLDSAVQGTNAH